MGDELFLRISRVGNHQYRAVRTEGDPDNLDSAEEYGFTVARHGRRWYLSAGLPRKLGGNFAILGFELTRSGELVLFNLDVARLLREVEAGRLAGEAVETAEGEGVLIRSALARSSVTWTIRPTPTFSLKWRACNASSSEEVCRWTLISRRCVTSPIAWSRRRRRSVSWMR